MQSPGNRVEVSLLRSEGLCPQHVSIDIVDVDGEIASCVNLHGTERRDVGRREVVGQEAFRVSTPDELIAGPKAEVQLVSDAKGTGVDWPSDELIKWSEVLENRLLQHGSTEFREIWDGMSITQRHINVCRQPKAHAFRQT